MAIPSLVNGSSTDKTALSDQEAYNVLSDIFKTDVDPNSPTATLLNINGVQSLCEAYRARASTRQIAMYFNGTVNAVEVWEDGLKAIDKKALRLAKHRHAIDNWSAVHSKVDADQEWLGELADDADVDEQTARAELVYKRAKAREQKVAMVKADVERYAPKEEQVDEKQYTVINQIVIADPRDRPKNPLLED